MFAFNSSSSSSPQADSVRLLRWLHHFYRHLPTFSGVFSPLSRQSTPFLLDFFLSQQTQNQSINPHNTIARWSDVAVESNGGAKVEVETAFIFSVFGVSAFLQLVREDSVFSFRQFS